MYTLGCTAQINAILCVICQITSDNICYTWRRAICIYPSGRTPLNEGNTSNAFATASPLYLEEKRSIVREQEFLLQNAKSFSTALNL